MKNPAFLFVLIIVMILSSTLCVHSQGSKSIQNLKGPYLGQKPPGLIPEVFASGIISDTGYRLHGFPAFSPDGNAVLLTLIPPEIKLLNNTGGVWIKPEKLDIPGRSVNAANFSNDGKRIYFQAIIEGGYGSLDIWYMDLTDRGWSNPINIGSPVNTAKFEGQPSFTVDKTIYFAGALEGSGWNRGIYRSRMVDGKYTVPEILNGLINSQYIDAYPFIAPDESFLLFSSSRPSMDENDLKIYVKWSEPVNLNGKMKFDKSSRFPYLSPDSKYLFFQSSGSIYWIDAAIIKNAKEY
ncbi:TolB family protein [candidate division KSB1 bacterium]